ncbi:MAG: hypothetical protein A2W52_01695 [Candidatus Taylorbacteria bacterium RIFCSPHIGHO2_02_49_25]|uniref:Glycosyltransferase RgtA/B/C/D-like domain-containing protein n=1 Tax=Candidatus Taylorbacteria bacterium RIFCSPHIGHO2_02_49_25 TaxID=1802305 RepID=A0A1G2MB41_9BACT|nr:MAG: hypothetical protein UY62_C0010G0010 [Parcubacteria group bacterium GW2011_GWF2_50_9]OHA19163.1 MAG: hypothetical protein A2759_00535 [Candidatus Taylorbacteria bacterium RIFCSPHIGHO2_01_FULL_49_60]OHA21106.1 MAG: hypothetical protein A2W52_01695 [Candidatus Taylorbacteria bacterium RIFCSPHIGHO2_02_49_25]OHA37307.1 MAG: hypothetical protein A2W65_03490 [Candidatus Taylorbacteria bacterium RIFCSPLOWO2_02_50_13]
MSYLFPNMFPEHSSDKAKRFVFLLAVLLFINFYSISTLTTKPAYWYDEAINVELARNFADFGKLDLVIAPNTFSGKGATVGSTGYPVTVPLAGFFKLFGFGLSQARIYMLLWMSALILVFFFIAKKLWSVYVAYAGTLLIATFAPFYGNGRSVMGEIPGFLFSLLSFYFLEQRKWWQSGILLGLAVISKPSIFIFLIPAYALAVLLAGDVWKQKLLNLVKLGASSLLALLPWFIIYAKEISRGGLGEDLLAHFKNPYSEAGASVLQNISNNLPTLVTSTTLLYFLVLFAAVILSLYLERTLFREYKNLFIFASAYLPLALLQYLKSFGYLRYLIAAELLIFILFLIALPVLVRWLVSCCHSRGGGNPENDIRRKNWVPVFMGMTLAVIISVQTVHLFWFSDLYPSEKTQKTFVYLFSEYPQATFGVYNVPQLGSLLPSDKKYQYLSTYGLSHFGVNPFVVSGDRRPDVIVADADDPALSLFYEKDTAFSDGFLIYKHKQFPRP